MHRAALVAIALSLAVPTATRAQDDDWGITRGDRSRPTSERRPGRRAAGATDSAAVEAGPADEAALRARYLRIVLLDPRDGFAMDRVLSLFRSRDGSLGGLETEMQARLESSPADRGARMILARIARDVGRLDDARSLYDAILEENAVDALAHRALATIDLTSGAPAQARQHLEAALAVASDDDRDETARSLAEVLFILEDWDAAASLYDDLARGSRGSFLRTEFARELAERGEHERAIAALQVAAESVAGDRRALAPILVLRARSEIALGLFDDAIGTLSRARSLTTASAGVRGEIAERMLEAYRAGDRLAELVDELGEGASGLSESMIRARALDELGRDDEAADAYARAAALSPRDPEPRTRGIRVLLRAGRLEDAIRVSSALVRASPRDPRFVTELAELHISAGQRDEGLRVLSDAARRAPREVALHSALAELYVRLGEPDLCEGELERLVALEPDDPMHRVALGDHRLSEGDREGALAAFAEVLGAVRDPAAGHALLGGVYADHDLLSDAIRELDEAVALAPDGVSQLRELARVLERAGEDRRAEETWHRVLALSGDDISSAREAREHVAGLWTRGRVSVAHATELGTAFGGSVPDLDAGRLLAEVLRRRGQVPEAIDVLRRVVELAPGDVSSLLLLERLEVQLDDRAGAIETLRRLAEADRSDAAQYYLRMSEHAAALYRDEEALAYVRRATELQPDGGAAFARLGALARRTGDVDQARRALRRAHELEPRTDATALALADLEIEASEPGRALEILRRVIEESPDDESVARAVRASASLGSAADTAVRDALLAASLDAPSRGAVRRLVVEAWSRATAHLRAIVLSDRGTQAEVLELRRLVTRALGPILGMLTEGAEGERRLALALVAPAGITAAVPALLALAASDVSIDLRHEALLGAGRAASSAHIERLAALAAAGNDLSLRVAAVWALGRLGADAELRAALTADEPSVRGMAALGLGRDDPSSATGSAVRGRALAELEARARAGVTASLVRALEVEANPGVLGCLALALARTAPEEVAAYLAMPERLAAPAVANRELLATALAHVALPPASAALAVHLASGTARDPILSALRRIGADPLAASPRRGESSAAYAMRALSLAPARPLDLEALLAPLAAAFSSALSSSEERAATALSLFVPTRDGWRLGAREASDVLAPLVPASLVAALVPEVIRWAASGSGELRLRALGLAASSGAPEAQGALVEALSGPAPMARMVLESLDVRACAPLVAGVCGALSASDDWGVRALAARALTGVASDDATRALAEALAQDPYSVVRDAAARALSPASAAGRLALCVARESDDEPTVRIAAGAALGDAICPP